MSTIPGPEDFFPPIDLHVAAWYRHHADQKHVQSASRIEAAASAYAVARKADAPIDGSVFR